MDMNNDAEHRTDAPCAHCEALEARVVELERRLAEKEGPEFPLAFKALRLSDRGWTEGWRLRPSPARRHWMDENLHSYQCLPLVMANQWGWQVLCPTDLQVTWTGRLEPWALRVEVEPKYAAAIKSQF